MDGTNLVKISVMVSTLKLKFVKKTVVSTYYFRLRAHVWGIGCTKDVIGCTPNPVEGPKAYFWKENFKIVGAVLFIILNLILRHSSAKTGVNFQNNFLCKYMDLNYIYKNHIWI